MPDRLTKLVVVFHKQYVHVRPLRATARLSSSGAFWTTKLVVTFSASAIVQRRPGQQAARQHAAPTPIQQQLPLAAANLPPQHGRTHRGQRCGGAQLHVLDRAVFRSSTVTLAILQTVKRLHGAKLELHADYFDKVMGTSTVREAFARDVGFEQIVAGFATGLRAFAQLRAPYLLYQ